MSSQQEIEERIQRARKRKHIAIGATLVFCACTMAFALADVWWHLR